MQQQLQPEEDHDAEPAQPQQQQSPQQQQPPEQQATQEVEPDTGAEQPEMDHDAAVTEDAEPVAAAPRKKKRYRRPAPSGIQRKRAKLAKAKERAQAVEHLQATATLSSEATPRGTQPWCKGIPERAAPGDEPRS